MVTSLFLYHFCDHNCQSKLDLGVVQASTHLEDINLVVIWELMFYVILEEALLTVKIRYINTEVFENQLNYRT